MTGPEGILQGQEVATRIVTAQYFITVATLLCVGPRALTKSRNSRRSVLEVGSKVVLLASASEGAGESSIAECGQMNSVTW